MGTVLGPKTLRIQQTQTVFLSAGRISELVKVTGELAFFSRGGRERVPGEGFAEGSLEGSQTRRQTTTFGQSFERDKNLLMKSVEDTS